jgi:ATP-dependent helicase HrpB
MRELPIDGSVPEIIEHLRHGSLVIVAPPGSGKTTRIPAALAESGLCSGANGAVVVLQPRRVAARAAAARVADERGWRLGEEVGYQVRFEKRLTSRTRVRFLTEGVLTRQLLDDPFLEGVGAVVIDEFHERNLEGDLAIALLREVQREVRPDLRIVVMSATLDAEPVSRYLAGCPIVRVGGGLFPVTITYRPAERPASAEAVASVIGEVLSDSREQGNILVFLPGAGEIRRAARAVEGLARQAGALVLPLYGALAAVEQDRAIRPSADRKIILSTNIAETSLTIDGVTTVIDSGLVRSVVYDDARGIDRWELCKISQASAVQRAGRAGRTGPGRCIRLWSERQQRGLAEFERPEIDKVDLSSTVLALHAWGQKDAREFGWFQTPLADRVTSAERLLGMLGAVEVETGRISAMGRRLLDLPVHPRLGRLVLAAMEEGQGRLGATIAALLSERDLVARGWQGGERGAPARRRGAAVSSDIFVRLDLVREAEKQRFAAGLRERGTDGQAAREVCRVRDDLLRRLKLPAAEDETVGDGNLDHDEAILRWLLLAYPDRVVKRRGAPGTGRMVGGRGVRLGPESLVHDADLFLAIDAREAEWSPQRETVVTVASAIKLEWLEQDLSKRMRRERILVYDQESERVVMIDRLSYDDLPLREETRPPTDMVEAGRVLATALAGRVIELIAGHPEAGSWLARLEIQRGALSELEWPELDPEFLGSILEEACQGKADLKALERVGWVSLLERRLSSLQMREMREGTPEQIMLPGGRMAMIRYETGRPPVISARVQDLFGWKETPRIARGRVGVLLEILGPNQRPVQITGDLRSFWTNTYAQVRKDLRGRYPKHAWPEDGLNAPPVVPKKRG